MKFFLLKKGFGDLVPGQKRHDKYAHMKQLLVCFYSLFGMAIIGMCFTVMQFVARRKIMWLFAKIKHLLCTCCLRRKSSGRGSERRGGGVGGGQGAMATLTSGINDANTLTEALIEKEKEKEAILHRLKLLQQYENAISAKRRRRHVLS